MGSVVLGRAVPGLEQLARRLGIRSAGYVVRWQRERSEDSGPGCPDPTRMGEEGPPSPA